MWLGLEGWGVCFFVSKRYVPEFFPHVFFPGDFYCEFYSMGFSPWA